jgi:hypothetical protein
VRLKEGKKKNKERESVMENEEVNRGKIRGIKRM